MNPLCKVETMQNRRNFLSNSLLTISGAGLAGKLNLPEHNFTGMNKDKIIYRTLGKTGIRIPAVSMGTNNAGSPALIRSALDKGVKLFATAQAYQNGNNEKMIGLAVKNLPRNSYYILTNSFDINWLTTKTGIINSGFSYEKLLKSVKISLASLGVEYADILTQPFAATRESVLNESVLRAMENLKKEGLTRFIGIATHRSEHEAIRAAADSGIHDIVMTSYNFLKTNLIELDDALNYAVKEGLGVIAMKTMAGTFWDKERTKPVNTRAALKWVLNNENIHTSVPDCSNLDQLNQDFEIMSDLKLSEQEMKDMVPPSGEPLSGLYCQQCGECTGQCPYNIDIPCFMRAYMYAYGHHNFIHAKNTIKVSGFESLPCLNCTTCSVTCKMGFNIMNRIADISRLAAVPDDFLV